MRSNTAVASVILIALVADHQQSPGVYGWSILRSDSSNTNSVISRRQAVQQTVAAVVAGTVSGSVLYPSLAAVAEEGGGGGDAGGGTTAVSEETPRVTTRMGGLLEAFQDGSRSIRIMAPSGWNKFDGEVGAYDVKWQDLVDPTENIKISSSPVKSTTESVALLGPVRDVGTSLAAKRNAKLLAASARQTDGVLFYDFDFAINDGTHQLLTLCVCKGKLWSLDASAKERRWDKRSELYKNVVGSFMPKLS
jgi:photosystem II oxygen-evolving enhancer protein 2